MENELFKMPALGRTLEQKRRKVVLEAELEKLEHTIESQQQELRKFTASHYRMLTK